VSESRSEESRPHTETAEPRPAPRFEPAPAPAPSPAANAGAAADSGGDHSGGSAKPFVVWSSVPTRDRGRDE
jgi:hypothetical protein